MNLLAKLDRRTTAILLMVATIFCFSSMDAIAKSLALRHDTMQVVWARYTSQTVLAFIFLAPRLRTLLRTRFLWLQVLRSAFLFAATICFFFGITLIGLANASAVMAVNPLIITVLAVLVLGEKAGPRRFLAVGAGFVGALIIIGPGSAAFSPAALLPLMAAFCYASYAISTRFLGAEESPWTSFLYTALIGAIAASLIVPAYWTTPTPTDAALMLAIGAVGGLGHICLIRAFTLSEASAIAPIAYVGLIFATFWGIVLFGEYPDRSSVLGALVIVGAGLYVWQRERNGAKRTAARS